MLDYRNHFSRLKMLFSNKHRFFKKRLKKNIVTNLVFYGLMVSIIASCHVKYNTNEYLKYSLDSEHILLKESISKSGIVSCYFIPNDVLICDEIAKNNIPFEQKTLDSLRSVYKKNIYFKIKVPISFELSEQKISSYANSICRNIFISTITQSDSMQCVTSLYARQYGTVDQAEILLVFNNNNRIINNGVRILYTDRDLGLGRLTFIFSAQDFRNLPTLIN